jgi:hypothetical protein
MRSTELGCFRSYFGVFGKLLMRSDAPFGVQTSHGHLGSRTFAKSSQILNDFFAENQVKS